MDHLAFYNSGCETATGRVGLKIRLRRLGRKLMLPASQRLVEILISLCRRLDATEYEIRDLKSQASKIPSTIAFGWDYVAMVRRLAVLEEHVDALLTEKKVAEAQPLGHHH
jgi:hypothetical protein